MIFAAQKYDLGHAAVRALVSFIEIEQTVMLEDLLVIPPLILGFL